MAANQGKWRRQLDLVSFFFTALPIALTQRKHDVLVATSPNFFAGLVGCVAATLRRTPFVLEVGDLWPAFAVSLGQMRKSLIYSVLRKLEQIMYGRADRIVCVTESFSRALARDGVPASKLKVILNGVELSDYVDVQSPSVDLRRALNPHDRFLVGYYGTQGLAHGLVSVVDAAKLLPDIQFLFVGGGADNLELQRRVKELEVENVSFLPMQTRDKMPGLISLCDVALVQLRNLPLLNTAIPSKIFEAMAAGRPILLAAPEGDASELIRDGKCGVHVPPEDPEALADAVRLLAGNLMLRSELSDHSRACALNHSRENQAEKMLEVLFEASTVA